MIINEYKKAMDEISVDTNVVVEYIDNVYIQNDNIHRLNYKKLLPLCIIMASLITVLFINNYNFIDKPVITITAYASGIDEVQLSDTPVNFNMTAKPVMGGSTVTDNGDYVDSFINYNIYFKCNGNNIDTITYKCSDLEITRYNRNKAVVYFVENNKMTAEKYFSAEYSNDKSFLRGYVGENEAFFTKMIGNYYTVAYDEQDDKQYGMEVAAKVDMSAGSDYPRYIVDDFIIDVIFRMKDGSKQEKQILIQPSEDAFEGLKIQIAN